MVCIQWSILYTTLPSSMHNLPTILVTKLGVKGEHLAQDLREVGCQADHIPMLEITPCAFEIPQEPITDIIFTSQYAVEYGQNIITEFSRAKYWAIGQGTAEVLQRFGIKASYPSQSRSEGLVEIIRQDSRAKHMLLVSGVGGRGYLDRVLLQWYRLSRCDVYQRHPVASTPPQSLPCYDVLIFTNPESLEVFLNKVNYNQCKSMSHIIVSSERMRDYALVQGFSHVTALDDMSNRQILACVKRIIYAHR